MTRITPDQVLEAFERTGFTPSKEVWFVDIESKRADAIGILAMIKLNHNYEGLKWSFFRIGEYETLSQVLGTGLVYMRGFIRGFEGGFLSHQFYGSDRYKSGYNDGKAAWEAVKHLE